jgi:ATP-dependent DNA helicase RecG
VKGANAVKIGLESERLEFKKTTAELNEAVVSIAAILNKQGSGELYFGVNNDGTPLGMDISDKTLRDISQAISQHLEPKIFPEITDVYFLQNHCIHVVFQGDDAPYFAFQKAYIRVADTDKQMTRDELERFMLQKNERKNTWDAAISERTIDEVDEKTLKAYLTKANRAMRIDFTYSTKEEVLNRLRLVKFGHVVNAADVLFCEPAYLETQMATFATDQKLTFLDIDRRSGRIGDLIEMSERYIGDAINWRVVFDGSIERKEIPEIPMDAVREALINSYCHRDYKSSQNNEILVFKNRVEIYNPGTFPFSMTPKDYIEGNEPSIRRNPRLSDLLYYSKDIESFGTGLRRISQACETAGVRVEFRLMKMGFAVVFYRRIDYANVTYDQQDRTKALPADVISVVTNDRIKANGTVNVYLNDSANVNYDILSSRFDPREVRLNADDRTSVQINEEDVRINEKDVRISIPVDVRINPMERQVLEIVAENPSLTLDEIALRISRTAKTAQRYLDKLRNKGIIRRSGSRKNGFWQIIADGKEPRL